AMTQAAQAGVETGQKRVAGQQEQAKEQSAERRAEQSQKATLAHLYSETAKNHVLANHAGDQARRETIEFNKPNAEAWLAVGEPDKRVGEFEAGKYLQQDPTHPSEYIPVMLGERDAIDPKTGKVMLDEN